MEPRVESWGDGIELRLPGIVTLTAEYEAEGFYESDAEGDPPEQDMFRIDVHPAPATGDTAPLSFPLLMPATHDHEEPDDSLAWVRLYLKYLARQLATAPRERWEAVCDASRTWSPAGLLDDV